MSMFVHSSPPTVGVSHDHLGAPSLDRPGDIDRYEMSAPGMNRTAAQVEELADRGDASCREMPDRKR
jgi:hypothetical protein